MRVLNLRTSELVEACRYNGPGLWINKGLRHVQSHKEAEVNNDYTSTHTIKLPHSDRPATIDGFVPDLMTKRKLSISYSESHGAWNV